MIDDILDTVVHGDALAVLKTIESNSVHALCCDPPCGISFMSRNWDDDKGGRTQWVSWLSEIMSQCLRVLLPGGHALIWSLPRQSHWTALALEDAGFTIRDCLYNLVSGDTILLNFLNSLNEEQQHAFMQVLDAQREPSGILHINGSGFPKSLSVDKAIERMSGIKRDLVPRSRVDGKKTGFASSGFIDGVTTVSMQRSNEPMTIDSAKWRGFGSALKPAVENWWLVRKPLAASSIAENVLQYGTGAINVDASRIGTSSTPRKDPRNGNLTNAHMEMRPWMQERIEQGLPLKGDFDGNNGRFPSHLLITHTPQCIQVGTKRVQANGPSLQEKTRNSDSLHLTSIQNGNNPYREDDGMETVTAWECPDWCPVRVLDTQGGLRKSGGAGKYYGVKGIGYGNSNKNTDEYTAYTRSISDEGYVSRYFQQLPALDDIPPYIYAGKASRRDRTADNTVINTHPTVKNVSMLRYFVRLLCPPNGIVLDCFAGSGGTGVACIHEGFHYILIEKEEEYVNIARSRIAHAISTSGITHSTPDMPLVPTVPPPVRKTRDTVHSSQLSLWNEGEAV